MPRIGTPLSVTLRSGNVAVLVEPAPYQRPHPPVWLAASSANSITLCARRGYNLLLRGLLGARFSDAQCGFKALRADAALAYGRVVEIMGLVHQAGLHRIGFVADPLAVARP